jgi:hypothetical protein
MTALVEIVGLLVVAIILIVAGRTLWNGVWLILALVVGSAIGRDGPFGKLIIRLLNNRFGTPTTDERRYECDCGALMTNTGAYSRTQYRVEHWECTDTECDLTGRAFVFDNKANNYGEGVLDGQVKP